MVTIQVFNINFWLKIYHINYSSKVEIFVVNANKMCKYNQIIKGISLFFGTAILILFCPKSCQDVTLTLFVYFSFGTIINSVK